MMRRHMLLLGLPVALMVTALGLTSCALPDQIDGQQEGVDAQPALDLSWFDDTAALDVVDAGLVAMAQITSVRLRQDAENPAVVTGVDGTGDGDPVVSKDLRIATGEGIGDAVAGDCAGTLQLPSWSEPAELVVQDDLGAFRGGEDFWLGFGGDLGDLPDVNDLLAEQYADAWTTVPGLAVLCDLADFLGPVASVVSDTEAVKAGLGDVEGVPAGRVVSVDGRRTITTWVQVAEPHLVLQVRVEEQTLDGEGATTTVTTFSDVDATVDVDFPAPEEILAFELPTESPVPPTDGGVTDG